MAAPYFVPSADLLPYWPHDLIATSDVGMLGRVSQYLGVTDFDLIEYEGALNLVGKLALWRQLVLDLPLIDGVALVIGQPGLNLTALPFELNFGPPAEGDTGDAAEKALNLFLKGRPGPYELLLPEVDIGLRLSPDDLRPMRPKVAADPTQGFERIRPARRHVSADLPSGCRDRHDTGFTWRHPATWTSGTARSARPGSSSRPVLRAAAVGRPAVPGRNRPWAFDLDPGWKGVFSRAGPVVQPGHSGRMASLEDRSREMVHRPGRSHRQGNRRARSPPGHVIKGLRGPCLRLAFRQNTLLEGVVQLAVKLVCFFDTVLYLDLAITNEPTLDFPESVGFMGAISGVQPPGPQQPPRQDEILVLPLDPVLRVGVKKLGVRAKPDPGGRNEFRPTRGSGTSSSTAAPRSASRRRWPTRSSVPSSPGSRCRSRRG